VCVSRLTVSEAECARRIFQLETKDNICSKVGGKPDVY